MNEIFTLRIEYSDALKVSPDDHVPEYDTEIDDVSSLLSDICEILQNLDVNFVVSGFGQDWPVDVNTDLLIILEQINDRLRLTDLAQFDFCLDFYEQGVERRLNFSESEDGQVSILCESDTSWVPIPKEISVDKESIVLMLNKLKSDFVSLARKTCPKLSSHAWFNSWVGKSGCH